MTKLEYYQVSTPNTMYIRVSLALIGPEYLNKWHYTYELQNLSWGNKPHKDIILTSSSFITILFINAHSLKS